MLPCLGSCFVCALQSLTWRALPAQNKPVAAAVLRVFGPQLAEVPLVATRHSARRQGHARVLMRAIEARPARARMPCGPQHRRLTHGRSGCCSGRMHTLTEILSLVLSEHKPYGTLNPTPKP